MNRKLLLIISGSIAAYKALELARLARRDGFAVTGLLTDAGARFVTPHALAAITGSRVFGDLWSLEDETHSGHIRLAREHDLVVVAPASADLIAKVALGLADDLASTVLLATTRPILLAPAMNPTMWAHPATQAHIATLRGRGVTIVGPAEGEMAEPESGPGRLVEPPELLAAIRAALAAGPLAGRHALVTSGPTREAIDPVRYIANRSSGRQGHAIAAALAALGARVTLVSGPVHLPDPPGVSMRRVESARDMLAACQAALPADIAVCAAAVADWRPATGQGRKIKKVPGEAPSPLALAENPDILATLARPGPQRPALVVGFAAETNDVIAHAQAKRVRKGCDWIVANDVSGDVMGGRENAVHIVTAQGVEDWPRMAKEEVARRLAARIAEVFA
ncbi:bifunctional phosphopantothenoylcysteine decarboxylase/phosphopantothenate--cysteine ligase CoaBC [Elioraea sp. Yellowstone]|jgi:phosphopantothenoylcysteine decarboxylase/phosphopantothenate--cysteine ligase|uniref:bifunctional phosphopantothenoylcysteine decarboxylase/phosphopantothenate--cysteine ligase CoaBC n=1 Tax=Elioraea sp. Yellowstone TaxID=2592070 RepID=UPI0011548605|nr:bifunctional phosphopantothenoylcysteine decarboxylase/phosphopantothenate--cysteine ligase CoaBC [Elioraea sp. Yellowstone]TQF77144.1 bifunctional phosphopantothenoylcysteine decarboxylase/phosphopantothenate--cysteine ligase CoaBC [Elioraea sp. Yellowstone]